MAVAVDHPIAHWIIMGEAGCGKTTSAATWPKPMIVFQFDPLGKEFPYLIRGDVKEDVTDRGTPIKEVISRKTGKVLIRIEHYMDVDPERPEAYDRFRLRMGQFHHEYSQWKTAIVDGVTFMELTARMREQFSLNKGSKEPRRWYAGSTEALEQMLMLRFGSLPINVVTLCHVDKEKDDFGDGVRRHNPMAPGRLRDGLPGGYSEMYRAYVQYDAATKSHAYRWQTRPNNISNAVTRIGAPDGVEQDYKLLWSPS